METTAKARPPTTLANLFAGAQQRATFTRKSTPARALVAALLTLPHLHLCVTLRRLLRLLRTTARPRLATETYICDLLGTSRCGQDAFATMDIMG